MGVSRPAYHHMVRIQDVFVVRSEPSGDVLTGRRQKPQNTTPHPFIYINLLFSIYLYYYLYFFCMIE